MSEFKTTPYAHQLNALRISQDRESYALLMEQGTGKTKVTIDTAAALWRKQRVLAMIVVAPNGVHTNWIRNELPTHMPDDVPWVGVEWRSGAQSKKYSKKLVRLFDARSELKILAINVEAFSIGRRAGKLPKGLNLINQFIARYAGSLMVVVDESSKIKNPRAQRTKNVLKLSKHAEYRRILTGTPITQSPLDLYAQMYFLDPRILGYSSFYAFKTRYAKIVKKNAVDGSGRTYQYEDIVGYQRLDELKERVDKAAFRVTKNECLDLPPKIYTQIIVQMSSEQRRLYNKLATDLLLEVEGQELPIPLVLTRLMRFQQITGGFVADGLGTTTAIPGSNPKVDALLDDLEELPEDESAIIWARFVPEIELIMTALREKFGGWDVAGAYYGGTSAQARTKLVDRFQAGRTRFFVGNPQAAGMGLTLHRASAVYYYSNGFALEDRLQSEDRAHRIGQHRSVVYKDIVCDSTIDSRVIAVLRSKMDLADAITGDSLRAVLGWTDSD